eukprot:s6350_g1.t1
MEPISVATTRDQIGSLIYEMNQKVGELQKKMSTPTRTVWTVDRITRKAVQKDANISRFRAVFDQIPCPKLSPLSWHHRLRGAASRTQHLTKFQALQSEKTKDAEQRCTKLQEDFDLKVKALLEEGHTREPGPQTCAPDFIFKMALRLLFVLAATRCAEASLRGNLHASAGSMSTDQLRETVLQEVMAALGTGNRVTDKRLQRIEAVLKPTFVAMPKNEHGKLEDAAARYVLHRLFAHRHAMQIKGLQADGMDWKNVTTSKVLEELGASPEHVPSFVLSLFEERLKDQGLGLHELTVLAATLEHLIHDEAVHRLEVVYEAHGLSQDARVKEVALQDLIDTYMTLFLVGSQNFSATSVSKERDMIVESYPGWQETRKFTMQVRSSMVAEKGSSSDPNFALENFSFRAATEIVEEIGERYGRWQDSECRDLKTSLLKSEHAGTGRVLLKDFYSAALGGQWQFSESIEYLRELGALDESDPSHLAVFIPNYVNSQSNCVASSSIYSVCCINECEALMGHLEAKVAAPQAAPKEILEIVASLPSATVRTPRQLPETLTARLEEVAAQHGGSVPLHGRLFAQWLHHAYPRECPYPHAAGKTSPMTADEWMQARGQAVSATTLGRAACSQMWSMGANGSADCKPGG